MIESEIKSIRLLEGACEEAAHRLDYQGTDLIEYVWVCERDAAQLDRIYAAVKFASTEVANSECL